jgi:hypothetical protein
MLFRPHGLLAGCMTVLVATAAAQQPSGRALADRSVLLPGDCSVGAGGRYRHRARGVRLDGSVAEIRRLDDDVPGSGDAAGRLAPKLLKPAVVTAATGATFDCRHCTEPVTPHTIAFVFSFLDSFDSPPPSAWKQTGDASRLSIPRKPT